MLQKFFFPHSVQVRDRVIGGMGASYGAPRTLDAEVLDEQVLVRDKDGQEVVSSTRVTVPLDSAVDPGAKVTVWPGTAGEREARVITVSRDENDPPLPSHLILRLE